MVDLLLLLGYTIPAMISNIAAQVSIVPGGGSTFATGGCLCN